MRSCSAIDSKVNAVIDKLAEVYPNLLRKPSRRDPFRTLIASILSQRTKDINSKKAMDLLFEQVSTPRDILRLRHEELCALIYCSGFYCQKADYIIGTCGELLERFDGDVPSDRDSLLSLPGVGPKTADVVLTHCFGMAAIPVDVHVSRVSKRLGLAPMDASPEEVQTILHSLISRDRYLFYDRSILRLGKKYCRTTNPLCYECPLKDFCDYQKRLAEGYNAFC